MAVAGGIIDQSNKTSADIEPFARFAIEEHNKKENRALEFVKVVSTKEQVVQGKMYYITIEVNEGGETKTYEAKVWVKPWEDFKQLHEFNLV
ncbi:cysteine proteinase inhibitor A-like [Rutidosis leptorrhynchoides]|uniref:cysteine proteinase inhibitor A-like n=1 Tax=Rutidosis leptorrhynchoides TaxID=125765 RepID=UPI003A98D52B